MKNIPDKPAVLEDSKYFLYLQENKAQKSPSALFCDLMSTVYFYGNLAQLSNLWQVSQGVLFLWTGGSQGDMDSLVW